MTKLLEFLEAMLLVIIGVAICVMLLWVLAAGSTWMLLPQSPGTEGYPNISGMRRRYCWRLSSFDRIARAEPGTKPARY